MSNDRKYPELAGVKFARMRANLTQEELCEKAGVSRRSLARAESGGDVRYSTLAKAATVLQLTVADLLAAGAPIKVDEAAA